MTKNIAILITGLLLTTSCQSAKYRVDVDAVSKTDYQAGQTFVVKTISEQADPLLKKQFEDYVVKGLVKKGFVQSSSAVSDIVVYLDYAISDPQEVEYSYSSPIIGQTGVSSSRTYGSVNSYTGSYSGTTTYTPTYGVTGYRNHSGTRLVHTRHLSLEALPFESKSREDLLWRTRVKSSGGSGDMRRVLPILVVASWQVFGEDTGGVISTTVRSHKDADKHFAYVNSELSLQ